MTKYEVKKYDGEVVAKFGTHEQAIKYVQSKDDPNIYVDVIEPPPPPPPPPGKLEIWWGEMMAKHWWFRYLHAVVFIAVGYAILDKSNNLYWTLLAFGVMLIGGVFAFEVLLVGLVLGFLYFIIAGISSMSVPVAVVFGACIIAYAIYKKKK